MGFDPDRVGRMGYWHFMAALDGFGAANGWKKPGSTSDTMSDQRLSELGIAGF